MKRFERSRCPHWGRIIVVRMPHRVGQLPHNANVAATGPLGGVVTRETFDIADKWRNSPKPLAEFAPLRLFGIGEMHRRTGRRRHLELTMTAMTIFYVATLARYVLVKAENEDEARRIGRQRLEHLHADIDRRLAKDVPVNILVVRPATEDEIELDHWNQEKVAGERADHPLD
jgi:hypothetical protein